MINQDYMRLESVMPRCNATYISYHRLINLIDIRAKKMLKCGNKRAQEIFDTLEVLYDENKRSYSKLKCCDIEYRIMKMKVRYLV
jgi:hypothetical protein